MEFINAIVITVLIIWGGCIAAAIGGVIQMKLSGKGLPVDESPIEVLDVVQDYN